VSLQESPAQIAARYGAVAPAGLQVQRLPRGASAFVLPVWTGRTLEYPDSDRRGWRAEAAAGRKRAAQQRRDNPAIVARRDRVAGLHAQGMITAEIVAETGLPQYVVTADLKARGLQPHCHIARRRPTLETSFRALVAQGHGEDDLIDLLGVPLRRIRALAAETGTALARELALHQRSPQQKKARRDRPAEIARRAAREAVRAERQAAREAQLAARQALRSRRSAADFAALQARYRALHAQGVTIAAAAAELGLTCAQLRRNRHRWGLPPSTGDIEARRKGQAARLESVRPSKAGAAGHALILQRHAAGDTVEAIAAQTGLTVVWLARFIRASGGRPLRQAEVDRAARAARIRALVADGRSAGQIAQLLDMSENAVVGFAARHGISLRRPACPKVDLAPRRAQVARMRAEGRTNVQIAVALNISESTVSTDLAAAGVSGTSTWRDRQPLIERTHPDLVPEVRARLSQGQTRVRIGADLGLTLYQVDRLRRAGGAA
jgi:DNA-binding CsgD family transcriptional regulator